MGSGLVCALLCTGWAMCNSRGTQHAELLSWSALESPLPTTQLQRVAAVHARERVAPPAVGSSEDELQLQKEIRTLSKLTAAGQQSSEENQSLLSQIKRPPTSGQGASGGDIVLNIGNRQGVDRNHKLVFDINFLGAPHSQPQAARVPVVQIRAQRSDGMDAKKIQSELSHQDEEIKSLLKATRALTADEHQRSRLTTHPESLAELGSFRNFRRTRAERRAQASREEADKDQQAKLRESRENQHWARLIQSLVSPPRGESAAGHLAKKEVRQRLAAGGEQHQQQHQQQHQHQEQVKKGRVVAEHHETRAAGEHRPAPVAAGKAPQREASAEPASKPAAVAARKVVLVAAAPRAARGAGASVKARAAAEVRGYMPASTVHETEPVAAPLPHIGAAAAARGHMPASHLHFGETVVAPRPRAVVPARAGGGREHQHTPSIQGQAMAEMGQLFDAAGEGREAQAVTAPLRRGAMRHAARAATGGTGGAVEASAQSEIERMEAEAGDAETMQVTGSINDLLPKKLQRRLGRRDVLTNAYGADARSQGAGGAHADGAGFRTQGAEQREFANLENVAGESFKALAGSDPRERSSQGYLGGEA